MAEQYERAKQILRENAEGHNKLAELLIEREVIFAEDLENIFGKRPWTSRSDELIAQNGDSDKIEVPETAVPEVPETEEQTGTDVKQKKDPSSADYKKDEK